VRIHLVGVFCCYRNDINGESSKIARALIESRIYREVVDFDNHLDDISLDWRNADIDGQIAQCI